MRSSYEITPKAQIITLVAIISAAVIFAVGLTAFMVTSHESAKSYELKKSLLSPQIASTLVKEPFIFDHIEYLDWVPETKMWVRKDIDLNNYQNFYKKIENDLSIVNPSIEITDLFNTNLSTLTIFIRSKNSIKPFQVVQLIQNYYRVEMPIDSPNQNDKWLYFSHPSIKEIFNALISMRERGEKSEERS